MKKMMPIFVSLFLAAAAILAAVFSAKADDPLDPLGPGGLEISQNALPGTDYTYTGGVLTIKKSTPITISGTTTTDRIVVDSPDGAEITLKGISVTSGDAAAFEIIDANMEGKTVIVTLDGSNSLTSGGECAGLQKNGVLCKLLIDGDGGLTATSGDGGAGIGGASGESSGNIEINTEGAALIAGEIVKPVTGGNGGAGIGGGKGGDGSDITISHAAIEVGNYNGASGNGNVINGSGSADGACIGGGSGGEGKNITITGGTLALYTGGGGAAIGGGKGREGSYIKITGGKVATAKSTYGAAIGGGEGADGHHIELIGTGDVVNTGSYYGAGIGGGSYGNGYQITIGGSATFTIGCDHDCAGIGGGRGGNGDQITIEGNADGVVTSGANGAAIGGGGRIKVDGISDEYVGGDGSNITINTTKTVTANGQEQGAGIGGGAYGSGTNITIKNGTVYANGGINGVSIGGAAIGGGLNAGGKNIKIEGGTVIATSKEGGAGIGGGAAYYEYQAMGGRESDPTGKGITISGGKVTVNVEGGGAGIGGGKGGAGGADGEDNGIIISGGEVEVIVKDSNGAGIGGGGIGKKTFNQYKDVAFGGAGTNITISGGTVTVKIDSGCYGAGIGGGLGKDGENITISDGTVTIDSNVDGAGIGGGGLLYPNGLNYDKLLYPVGGNGNGITITGGNVTAICNSGGGAAIGGGVGGDADGITISGGTVTASGKGGAGIGGGAKAYLGGTGKNIKIFGTANVTADSNGGAGIGGGSGGQGKNIIIDCDTATDTKNGGKVTATGNGGGAGIGGGPGGAGTDITISGGEVTATSNGGAGVGGGQGGAGNDIKIIGGKVTAVCGKINEDEMITAGSNGAGIGGGNGGNGTNITISGEADVTAYAGQDAAGIGGGAGGSGIKIEISDEAKVTAICNALNGNGAGIGGGNGGDGRDITISGNATVTATSSGYSGSGAETGNGAGIGGGNGGSGIGIKITGCKEVNATGRNGAGIGGGVDGSGTEITISGGKNITATGLSGGAGIGGGAKGTGNKIYIYDAEVTANGVGGAGIGGGVIGNGIPGNAEDIKIYGKASVTATGDGGAGIGGGAGGSAKKIEIYDDAYVVATGIRGSAGIGAGAGAQSADITISGGTVFALGNTVGIGDQNGIGTVKIRGTDSTDYPWVFTNSISSANYANRENADDNGYWGIVFECADGNAFTDIEDNNFKEGIVYGTNQEVKITEDYTLTTGKKLTVLSDVTFVTDNKFTADGSVLYLKEGATLNKWYEMETINDGEIQHEGSSVYKWYYSDEKKLYDGAKLVDPELWDDVSQLYINDETDREGIVLCDICGKPEPHHPVTEGDWITNETHHWHLGSCKPGNDCAVAPFTSAIKVCSYIVDGSFNEETQAYEGRLDYGKHRYDFDNPYEIKDGKLRFLCLDCKYPTEIDIPTISLNKTGVDIDGEAPLAGAEFGIYTNAGCTGDPYMTGTTAIDADSGKAVVSFSYIDGDTIKYIRPNATYYLKEINAPDGYRISNKVFMAVVAADGKVTYGDVGAETTEDAVPECRNYSEEIAPDPAILIKTDGEGKPLVGAMFGIYSDADCTTRITTAITVIDSDEASDTYNKAVAVFDTEPDGTYYIKETKAPDGYKLSDKIFKVTVGADGKVTYGNNGSEELPVCENTANEPEPNEPEPDEPTPEEPTPDEPTPSEPTPSEPTPSEPTPSEPKPGNNDNPNTGVGIGIAGAALLGGSVCAASKKKKANKK